MATIVTSTELAHRLTLIRQIRAKRARTSFTDFIDYIYGTGITR